MTKTRLTITLSSEILFRLRQLQAKTIKKDNKSYSLSAIIEAIIQRGLQK